MIYSSGTFMKGEKCKPQGNVWITLQKQKHSPSRRITRMLFDWSVSRFLRSTWSVVPLETKKDRCGVSNRPHILSYPRGCTRPKSTVDIAFRNDGQEFATTHGDHTVKIWDTTTLRCTDTLVGHPRTPWSVRYHPRDKHILASGCLGGIVRIWDTQTGACLNESESFVGPIVALDFHPEKSSVFVASLNSVSVFRYGNRREGLIFHASTDRYNFPTAVRFLRVVPGPKINPGDPCPPMTVFVGTRMADSSLSRDSLASTLRVYTVSSDLNEILCPDFGNLPSHSLDNVTVVTSSSVEVRRESVRSLLVVTHCNDRHRYCVRVLRVRQELTTSVNVAPCVETIAVHRAPDIFSPVSIRLSPCLRYIAFAYSICRSQQAHSEMARLLRDNDDHRPASFDLHIICDTKTFERVSELQTTDAADGSNVMCFYPENSGVIGLLHGTNSGLICSYTIG
eukprot:23638_1